jgi:outer membrane protein OmpA-like peptidoglycan-associated protein
MTWSLTFFVLALTLALALGPVVPANAQVTIDHGALDSLPEPTPPAAPRPARSAVRRVPPHPHAAAPKAAVATRALPATPPPPVVAAPLPAIPPVAPAAPVIPPPIIVPTLPPPPPPPVPVTASAPGTATPIPGGLRITFGPDGSDLNTATVAALTELARTAQGRPDMVFNLLAHAPGVPEDPSSPRRLSITRGLAARAVLINQGIPSTRIYVRALGPQELGDGPANRVDVLLGPTPSPAAPPPAPPQ